MRWLIDGYNVIRRDPDLRDAESAGLHAGREALLRKVASAARRSPDRFTVVFDGAPARGPAASPGRVEVKFSRPPRKADDDLVALARQEGAGAVVVTSDRAVADAAHRARCAVVSAGEFVSALDAVEAGAGGGDLDDDVDDRVADKRGNPRRPSRVAREAQRALRRLRGR